MFFDDSYFCDKRKNYCEFFSKSICLNCHTILMNVSKRKIQIIILFEFYIKIRLYNFYYL